MGITVKVETITPEIAKEYLKHNTDNFRKLRKPIVKEYANDIVKGRWQLNGETIVFSESGILKNGQHRLAAIILADKPIQCIVVRGISNDVNIWDSGKVRTLTELAKARDIDISTTQIAAANIIVNRFSGQKCGDAVLEYAGKHVAELDRAVRLIGKGGSNAPSVVAAYLMLRNKIMPCYEIELFFRLLYDFGFTCADGYEVSPALVAQRMFDERGVTRGGSRAIQRERLEILVMALQDFHKGKKREMKYKVCEPFQYVDLLDKVRKEDGLEA